MTEDQDPPSSDLWNRLQQLHGDDPEPTSVFRPEDLPRPEPRPEPVPEPAPEPGPTSETDPPKQYFIPAPVQPSIPQAPSAVPSPTVQRERAKQAYQSSTAPSPSAANGAGRQQQGRGSSAGAPPAARTKSSRWFVPKAKWFRPKLRWIFLYFPLLILLAIGGAGIWAWTTINGLYRVELGDALTASSGGAINYLIVGSDSREGADPNAPDAGVIGQVAGRRSDTIIVLRVEKDSTEMMSIPRDLWVTNVATGKKGRINATYNAGPDNLVRSVTANLGIPINRYVEVDFVSFAGMVDAVGGIDIDFPNPVFDRNSGLKIETAGTQTLDGAQALAYVRSRHYTEIIDGTERVDPTADLGRQQRQQNFIRTVLSSVGGTRNPITLANVARAAVKGVRVDSELGVGDMLTLARRLGSADPTTVVLPTAPANKGGASVLLLKDAEALPVLVQFGAGNG